LVCIDPDSGALFCPKDKREIRDLALRHLVASLTLDQDRILKGPLLNHIKIFNSWIAVLIFKLCTVPVNATFTVEAFSNA
jgi:hypothetical protein